jgi:dTDP-4-dehydrorhamnose 3,5-epimerase
MQVKKATIPEVLIIKPEILNDNRGVFLELFQGNRYAEFGISRTFVQDNLSRSTVGVLRGLHFQNPSPQGKLVTVIRGCILDVAVDVRLGSPTFGKHVKIELSEENRLQVWIPRGFAHGFLVLSEIADFYYKCDEFYSPADEVVLQWDDPELGIDWGSVSPKVSQKDSDGRTLSQLAQQLPRHQM